MSIQEQIDSILSKKLKERVNRTIDDSLLNKVGLEARKQILKRTRLGKGVKYQGGPAFKLPSLKDSTIDQRERYDFNLSPFTRPPRSNLTATGQLLDSIRHRLLRTGKNRTVELYFKENRRFELSGPPSKVKHSKLSKFVADNGRPFFNLAGFEIAKLRSILFRAFTR